MNEPFVIPVLYEGTTYELKARFERWGYTHRIAVLINDITLTFEPDEEGSYRVLTDAAIINSANDINLGMLQAVAEKLAKLFD
jgi:hypothetical protein